MRPLSQTLININLVNLLLLRSGQAAPSMSAYDIRGAFVWHDHVDQPKTPALYQDFPDPSILEGPDKWYAFATASGDKRVQYATAPDPSGPWTYVDEDLLPDPGSWTDGVDIWAPDVRMVDDGTYVMYYTAALANNTAIHCLGVATSDNIDGPYSVNDEYWHCDEDQGGSIDSSGFVDSDGTRYVTWKIDGNSDGNGGSCDNTVAPIKDTPIMLQQVEGDGTTKVGDPVQILDRVASDGPLVEAPNIVLSSSGKYVLFYSSHCFTSTQYNVLYATADAVTGPYTRSSQPFLQTSMFNLTSPGGGTSTVGEDSTTMLFHANCPTYVGGSNRCMFVSSFTEVGMTVLANRR
ncbi:family 43 glycoside hydrolase [Cryphonectria parasitica EP155]|uniref:Family 43 glycoside hydrolase n=1 Tax=Cryphonectria parasitica (strain ATCC 38755 / EP155) TaxID=660469 RepID=A0A9P4YEU9_CRYP1|nr:family 43 glycoside hydrolase [Cryphonectria parasitica EP155]KAF3771434.1 family 43 glycoside hydrolase [Cryphonectria parasitica EP155]